MTGHDNETIRTATAEQEARDMLERMGVSGAQYFSAGDLVELANLIAENNRLSGELAVAMLNEKNRLGPFDLSSITDDVTIEYAEIVVRYRADGYDVG